jgi:phosphoglycerate dehydrogenase-like enzyme
MGNQYLVGKKMDDIFVIGQAIRSRSVIEKLQKYFNVIHLEKVDNPSIFFSERKIAFLLWIHFDTIIDNSYLPYLKQIKFLITTTTGNSHICNDVINDMGNKILSLKNFKVEMEIISSTAEHSWALMMAYHHEIISASNTVKNGTWDRNLHFRNKQIQNLNIGIIGFGRLGKMTHKYASAFGSKILVNEIDKNIISAEKNNRQVVFTDLNNLLNASDYVFIHASVKNKKKQIIDEATLSRVTSPFVLINTSRGCLVNELTVLKYIESGLILGYLADVIALEDFSEDMHTSELFIQHKKDHRILLTPHIGGASQDASEYCENLLAEKLISDLQTS